MKRHLIILNSLLLAVIGLMAVSCTKDMTLMLAADEVSVHFRIRTPRPTQIATRAALSGENLITKITLLVFYEGEGENEGEFVYQYAAAGKNIDPADKGMPEVDFEATLRAVDQPVKLLVIANCPVNQINSLAEGTTEDVVRQTLIGAEMGAPLTDGFPMTGVVELESISQATGSLRIPMLRSNAKISIAYTPTDTPNFEIASLTVYRPNDFWQYFPNADMVENEEGLNSTYPRAMSPSIPADRPPGSVIPISLENGTVPDFYINESEDNSAVDEATCIVVGGLYNGSESPTFYRLDIGGTDTDDNYHPFGQVLRNYWYQFTITNVTGPGWPDEEAAANNPSTEIVADVMPWNGGSNSEYHFGKDRYIVLSKDSLMLGTTEGDMDTLYITTSGIPFTIDSERPSAVGLLTTDDPSQTVDTHYITFTMTPVPAPQPGQQKWMLIASSVTDNMVGDNLQLIAVGNLMNINIPVVRNAEFSVTLVGAPTVPNTGTPVTVTDPDTEITTTTYSNYVEYQVNIPDGMTWSATVIGQGWVSPDAPFNIHQGYLIDPATGEPSTDPNGSILNQTGAATLRVGYDQLFYPITGESPQMTIQINLDNTFSSQIITVAQDPLPLPVDVFKALEVYNGPYQSLTKGGQTQRLLPLISKARHFMARRMPSCICRPGNSTAGVHRHRRLRR